MNSIIIEALKKININASYGWFDDSIENTQITFFKYNEIGDSFSDDEYEVESYFYQIDIWSKTNIEILKENIKTALGKAGFKYINGHDQFEIDIKLYHKSLRFVGYKYI